MITDAAHPPGRTLALWGLGLQAAPLFGVMGTVVGMVRSFSALADAQGVAHAEDLSHGISIALVTTAAGLVLAVIGLVLLAISIIVLRYRSRWLFWWLVAIFTLWLVAWPAGTVAGAVMLLMLTISRKGFFTNGKGEQSHPAVLASPDS